jgi:hypothetical protein
MPNPASPAKCPHCGFVVLTNRYPKCERCDRLLPKDMVLSQAELEAVFARERLEREEAGRKAHRKEMDKPMVGIGGESRSGPSLDDWLDLVI